MDTGQMCEWCFDEKQTETPATRVIAGIPLCGPCSSMTKQQRFEQKGEDEAAPVLRSKNISPSEIAKLAQPSKAAHMYETDPGKHNEPNVRIEEEDEDVISEPVTNVTNVTKGPLSAVVARRGIQTGADFCNFMSALMVDLVEKRVSASEANAACNAGSKLLQMVEMQLRHRSSGKILKLSDGFRNEQID